MGGLATGAAHAYDVEGHRVMKTVGSTTTVYAYNTSSNVAAEYSTNAPSQQGTLYTTVDHLGSTRLVLNSSGAPVDYHDYLPFGEEIPAGTGGRGSGNGQNLYGTADGLTHKFTGKEGDAELVSSAMQGLDYFGARYFSGAQGRFTSPDPVWVNVARLLDPQRFNLYAYGRNNPLKFFEPHGNRCCSRNLFRHDLDVSGRCHEWPQQAGQSPCTLVERRWGKRIQERAVGPPG